MIGSQDVAVNQILASIIISKFPFQGILLIGGPRELIQYDGDSGHPFNFKCDKCAYTSFRPHDVIKHVRTTATCASSFLLKVYDFWSSLSSCEKEFLRKLKKTIKKRLKIK